MQIIVNDAISLNARMIITEEKIISNIYKVKKLISPNSKRQIIKLEDDAYFKDLVESITSYLKEYPNKKNFPQDVYKEAYDLVEYATEEFGRNNRKVEELITKREQNIKQAMLLKEAYETVSEKEEGWIDTLGRYEGRFSKKIAESLTIIANEGNKTEEEIEEAKTTITSKISNLESNLFIQIDLERIEDRTKALSYIGIEVAESLRQIPAAVDTDKLSSEEKELLEQEIQKEKEELELQKIETEKRREQERIEKEQSEKIAQVEQDSFKIDSEVIENQKAYAGRYNVISYNELPDTNQVISFAEPITQISNTSFETVENNSDENELENFNIVFKKPQVQNVQTYNISKNIEANDFTQMIAEDIPKIQNTVVENAKHNFDEITLDPIMEMEKLRSEIVTSPIIDNYIKAESKNILENNMSEKQNTENILNTENTEGLEKKTKETEKEEFKIVFKNMEGRLDKKSPIEIILKDEPEKIDIANNQIDNFIEDKEENNQAENAESNAYEIETINENINVSANNQLNTEEEVQNVLREKRAKVLEELVEEKEDVIPNTNAYNSNNIMAGEALAGDILNAFENTEKIAIDQDIYNLKGQSDFGKEEQVENVEEIETTQEENEGLPEDLLEHVDVFAKLLGKDAKEAKIQKLKKQEKEKEEKQVKLARVVPKYEEDYDELDEDEQEIIDNYGRDEYYAKTKEQGQDTNKIIENSMFKNEEEKKAFFEHRNMLKKDENKGLFSKIKKGLISIFAQRAHEEPNLNKND